MSRTRPRTAGAWLAGCLALVALAACGDPEPPALAGDALRFVEGVERRVARGERPDAFDVQRLKELGLAHPADARVSPLLLQLLPGLRDWDGLARWLEAKGELDDEEQLALARVYVNLADHAAAWRVVAPLAERAPAALEPNALAGRVAFMLGEDEAAARHLDRVWDALCAAGRVQEMSFRALLFLDAGELERARAVLEQALAADADSVHAHNALARVLAAAGDDVGAARHEQRATELQAAFSAEEQRLMRRAAQNRMLNEAWARRDFEGCRALVLRFLLEADDDQAVELLGFLEGMYRAAGREAEAPAALEEARSLGASGR